MYIAMQSCVTADKLLEDCGQGYATGRVLLQSEHNFPALTVMVLAGGHEGLAHLRQYINHQRSPGHGEKGQLS